MNRFALHHLTPILVMFAVLAFEMSTDIYLPSLPEMAHFYNVPDAAVKTTLGSYLLGLALLGLIAGPLSDHIGRRPVMVGSLSIFALGSLACWLVPTISGLILARFVQGTGAGMTLVVSTAILKDIYDEKNLSRILSTIGMIIALSPMVAPILGGKIAENWGWKSCFFLIAFTACLIWAAFILCLRESLEPENRKTRAPFLGYSLLASYGQLLKCRQIVTFALISAVTYGGLWAWIVEAPFYFIEKLGVPSVDYGYYGAIGPGAYIFGTILNRRCVTFYGVEKMLTYGLGFMIMGAGLTLFSTFYWPYSLIALYISFPVYAIGLAPVFANATTKAVAVIPSWRGSASALLTAFETAIASLCVLLVSRVSNGTLVPCALIMLATSLLCAALFFAAPDANEENSGILTSSEG